MPKRRRATPNDSGYRGLQTPEISRCQLKPGSAPSLMSRYEIESAVTWYRKIHVWRQAARIPAVQKIARTFPTDERFRGETRCRDAVSWAGVRWSGTAFTLIR